MHSDHAGDGAPPGDIADALAVIRKALDASVTQPPSPVKTALLRDLADGLEDLTKQANDLRAEYMKEIYESQSISLAALGDVFRVSRQRAGQLINGNRSGKGRRDGSNA